MLYLGNHLISMSGVSRHLRLVAFLKGLIIMCILMITVTESRCLRPAAGLQTGEPADMFFKLWLYRPTTEPLAGTHRASHGTST